MANNKTKSSKATKASSKKLMKVAVPEPQILVLGYTSAGNQQVRFEQVHIGSAFLHAAKEDSDEHLFLKVGKTSAMCLQSYIPEGSRAIGLPPGAKVSFRAATKVELVEIDNLAIKLKGKASPKLAAPLPAADAATKASVDALQQSDLSSAVLERAGS